MLHAGEKVAGCWCSRAHFLLKGSTMPDVSLEQIFGLTLLVLVQYLDLQETLHVMEAAIVFPRTEIEF